jgi:hypothetical protein
VVLPAAALGELLAHGYEVRVWVPALHNTWWIDCNHATGSTCA